MADEDDGMLMNFSMPPLGAAAAATKKVKKTNVKIKGGRWADRRKTQLELMGRTSKGKKQNKVSGANDVPVAERKRSSDDHDDHDIPADFKKVKSSNNTTAGLNMQNGQIVTSLFTANPEVQKRDYEKVIDESKLVPSNAPLLDDPNADFAALGLHPNLVKCLNDLRYTKPTKIQRLAIPKLISLGHQRTRTNPFPPQPRDMFMQAQTGSGKTMAFTLPIINKILSTSEKIDRKSGIYALILTPTRELAQQIYSFIEDSLCKKACHWIVPGIVIGGEKKKAEKARLRKGINILVATPGRLVDHIENTQSLNLSTVRYLVLDEGDRLVELGFEESITKIIDRLQKDYRDNDQVLGPLADIMPPRRVSILCSATLKGDVKKLGEIALNNPETISASSFGVAQNEDLDHHMKAPDQLVQEIVVVPPKLRYTTLSGTLMNMTKNSEEPTNFSKTVVFLSCSHSVDFHFIALTKDGKRLKVDRERKESLKKIKEQKGKDSDKSKATTTSEEDELIGSITAMSAPHISPNTIIYKLHGSLSQQTRTATLNHFANDNKHNTILLCTDVASRGLDLPAIDYVVEYDPPFCVADHLHRVGRTARLGKSGLSILFLMPGNEEKYIEKITPMHDESNVKFISYEEILTKAFAQTPDTDENSEDTGKKKGNKFNREGSWDMHATTYQLELEKWLLEDDRALEIATDGFISHVRAYATHLSTERDIFNVKQIHLGHLAKAFGLRETPKKLATKSTTAGDDHNKKESAKNKMWRLAREAARNQNDEFNFA